MSGSPGPQTIPEGPGSTNLSAGRSPGNLLALAGAVLLSVVAIRIDSVVNTLGLILQGLFVVFFLRHFAFALCALRTAPADLAAPAWHPGFVPSVSVLVACRNEEQVVEGLVASLLALDYPAERLEVVVVDDGSTDRTAEMLESLGRVQPRLHCLHRPPGGATGKSAALNAALPRLAGEIIVVFDADHRPRPDSVRRLVSHFSDPTVAAVQGRCEIGNRGDSTVTRLIAIDYLAGYLVNEYGRQALFQLPAYGGANCAVRATSVRAVGGWNPRSLTEDTDLTLRLLLRGDRIRYEINAVDREEGVVTLGRYWRQRYRWARGHQQVWRDYRRAVWTSRRLSPVQKVETTMFLLVFHLPVASAIGLVVLGVWSAGLAHPSDPLHVVVFWTLLFLGPLLELGAGLLVSDADRRDALAIAFFLPLFFVSIALCTKAWLDGLVGRRCDWSKTARAGDRSAAGIPT